MSSMFLSPTLGLFGPLSGYELIILAIFGVLIFGKRLPEVGRSIGKGIVEFKKGLAGIDEDATSAANAPPQIEANRDQTVDTKAKSTPESTTPSA